MHVFIQWLRMVALKLTFDIRESTHGFDVHKFNGVGIIPSLKEGGWYFISGLTIVGTCIFIDTLDSLRSTIILG